MTKKNVISFSLWGDNPKYTLGALKNVELAPIIYPGWICRIYIAPSVPQNIVERLTKTKNVEIIKLDYQQPWEGSFWRFLPASDPDVAITIIRDTDSRLNWREKAAVEEWLQSDCVFHIMRDHPLHCMPIMAGMWGIKGGFLTNIQDLIQDYTSHFKKIGYGIDQKFLSDLIFPLACDHALIHDEFFAQQPFPTPRKQHEFVGQVFFANNTTPQGNVAQLVNYFTLRDHGKKLEQKYRFNHV